MKKIFLLLLSVIAVNQLFAQATGGREVSGIVQDTAKNSVIAATVKLISGKDTLATRTNIDGAFTFRNVTATQFAISVTSLGLAPFSKGYTYPAGTTPIKLPTIEIKSESNVLKEVVISGTAAITIKEDTISYKVSDYKVRENATTEDLLKKVEGVEVDQSGNVTAQGKQITKVRVNGKDYFGGDVKTATQNLPAELLESIQIVDDYGDQANITGVRTGEPEKVLNIVIKPENNKGYYANASAGSGGGENNVSGLNRYQASLNGNYFNNDQQIAILSNFNNNNTSTFNFGSQGGGQQGGNRGPGGGGGGITSPSGITKMGSLGFNYRDEWGKKLSSYGSYSFFDRNNNAVSNSLQQTNNSETSTILNNALTNAENGSTNHRISWNLEWKPTTSDYFKFTPNYTYSSSSLGSTAQTITQNQTSTDTLLRQVQNTLTNTSTTSPSYGGNLLYNHRFGKTLRNISLNLSVTQSHPKSDQAVNNNYYTYNDAGTIQDTVLQNRLLSTNNKTLAFASRFVYIEPLSEKSTLELNYNYNRTNYDNNRNTYNLLDNSALLDSLSNTFNYSFTTNNVGLTYRFREAKFNYQIGMSIQPTLLEGQGFNYATDQMVYTHRTGFNFVPVARFVYKFSRTKEFNFSYNGRSMEPSYTQINPVADLSNSLRPVIGNPDLNAAFNHSINVRFNNFDFTTGRVLFFNLNSTFTQNQIVTNNINTTDETGAIVQRVEYLNASGNYSLGGFYNYSIPFAEKKYTLSYGGNVTYSNNVSFSNSAKDIGKNTVISQRLRLVTYPVSWLEFDPNASFTYNKNNFEILTRNNSEIKTWNLGGSARIYFLKSFLIGTDVSKSINSGYVGSVNVTNPLIMNSYLEKQFFKDKRGTLRLTGYDLFNQNTAISRYINGNTTTDSRSNSLGRYFMLSFTMRLQKFGAGGNSNQNRDGFPGGNRGPGGGFPGGGRPGGGFPGGGGGFPRGR